MNAMLLRTYEVNEILNSQDDRSVTLVEPRGTAVRDPSAVNTGFMSGPSATGTLTSTAKAFGSTATPSRGSLSTAGVNGATQLGLTSGIGSSAPVEHLSASKSKRESSGRWMSLSATPSTSFHLDSVPCPTPISRLRTGMNPFASFLVFGVLARPTYPPISVE